MDDKKELDYCLAGCGINTSAILPNTMVMTVANSGYNLSEYPTCLQREKHIRTHARTENSGLVMAECTS